MRTTIVSAGDAAFFPQLKGLIASIYDHRPDDRIDISLIDVGLLPEQLAEVGSFVRNVAPGQWNFEFPKQAQSPRWMQAQSSRPFLRQYFPGYDVYLWMDGDTWLQDWRAVDLLIQGAQRKGLAIVPEIHCAYPYLYGEGNLPQYTHRYYEVSFGAETANKMWMKPIFNSGVFALAHDTHFWLAYADRVKAAFSGVLHKWAEQCALNLVIYANRSAVEVLPAWCNWICCYALPALDPVGQCLCEPIAPYQRLSVVHMTQMNKGLRTLGTTDQRRVTLPLDYLDFKAAVAEGAGA
ncbi:MAG: hypothetical protein ABR964_04975 [Tepidisphaeraceae bacterium]|jgi:lipopolysaccharide biosynthesis glycosyltransferase